MSQDAVMNKIMELQKQIDLLRKQYGGSNPKNRFGTRVENNEPTVVEEEESRVFRNVGKDSGYKGMMQEGMSLSTMITHEPSNLEEVIRGMYPSSVMVGPSFKMTESMNGSRESLVFEADRLESLLKKIEKVAGLGEGDTKVRMEKEVGREKEKRTEEMEAEAEAEEIPTGERLLSKIEGIIKEEEEEQEEEEIEAEEESSCTVFHDENESTMMSIRTEESKIYMPPSKLRGFPSSQAEPKPLSPFPKNPRITKTKTTKMMMMNEGGTFNENTTFAYENLSMASLEYLQKYHLLKK